MSRPLRRLVAVALFAGSVFAVAPQAHAHVYCYEFTFANGYFHGCI